MLMLASALMLGSSCDGLGTGASIGGFWIGYDGNRRVRLALGDFDGEIGGSGDISAPYRTLTVRTGTRVGNEVLIPITAEHDGLFSFGTIEGVRRGDVITASLSGQAFTGSEIVLQRQP